MIKVQLLNDKARVPTVATEYSAGWDLYACEDCLITPGCEAIISTGIALDIPVGYFGLLTHRSSIAFKGDTVASLGIIDADYRGEVKVKLFHLGFSGLHIKAGDRVAQIVFIPYSAAGLEVVDSFGSTKRGLGGFGSTGE